MTLDRTCGVLIGLSLGSTALAAGASIRRAALVAILVLAWIKAHLILKVDLGLSRVPQVLRGFDIVLGLGMVAILGPGLAG